MSFSNGSKADCGKEYIKLSDSLQPLVKKWWVADIAGGCQINLPSSLLYDWQLGSWGVHCPVLRSEMTTICVDGRQSVGPVVWSGVRSVWRPGLGRRRVVSGDWGTTPGGRADQPPLAGPDNICSGISVWRESWGWEVTSDLTTRVSRVRLSLTGEGRYLVNDLQPFSDINTYEELDLHMYIFSFQLQLGVKIIQHNQSNNLHKATAAWQQSLDWIWSEESPVRSGVDWDVPRVSGDHSRLSQAGETSITAEMTARVRHCWLAAFLLAASLETLETRRREEERGGNCEFPSSWQGDWFLSGKRDNIKIELQQFGLGSWCFKQHKRWVAASPWLQCYYYVATVKVVFCIKNTSISIYKPLY